MLEYLRKQERLSEEAEERVEKKIRIAVLVLAAVVVTVIVVALVRKVAFGTWYYALILSMVAAVWIVRYVLSAFWKHSLAGRTDKQVFAYLKAAGLELIAYAGLCWFLVALQGNAIIGAAIYLFGITGARKQREIYYEEPEPSEETSGSVPPDSGEGKRVTEESSEVMPALPSAADREQRERESEDGSV